MTKLKRCPFCGGEAEMITDIPNFTGCFDLNVVECKKCHCQTEELEARWQVIESWNTRTSKIAERGETYKDAFLKRFPNAERKYEDELIVCVKDIFGKEHELFRNCIFSGDCEECWNREVEEWRIE